MVGVIDDLLMTGVVMILDNNMVKSEIECQKPNESARQQEEK